MRILKLLLLIGLIVLVLLEWERLLVLLSLVLLVVVVAIGLIKNEEQFKRDQKRIAREARGGLFRAPRDPQFKPPSPYDKEFYAYPADPTRSMPWDHWDALP
ncbi:MAG: hypothetical protein QXU75_08865 [Candidatus Methanomethylicaceae archaeon]